MPSTLFEGGNFQKSAGTFLTHSIGLNHFPPLILAVVEPMW